MPPERLCVGCGVRLPRQPGAGRPRTRCDECRTTRAREARRGIHSVRPCVGCGSTTTGRHDYCPPCRERPRSPGRPPIGCANPRCQRTIERPRGRQRWCSPACRHRVQDAQPGARARWTRKNAKRRPEPRSGAAWDRLRLQVLAEEPDCWVCGDPIDPALRWPDAMCGTADHVRPLEDGGALLDRSNVRAAHRTCNQRRHVEWRRARRVAKRAA